MIIERVITFAMGTITSYSVVKQDCLSVHDLKGSCQSLGKCVHSINIPIEGDIQRLRLSVLCRTLAKSPESADVVSS